MNWPLVQAVLLSLLPGVFWLWYVVGSSPRPPRRWLLLVALGAGALSTQPVLALGWLFDQARPEWNQIPVSLLGQFGFFVVNVGLVEESVKLLAVRLTVYRSADFQEPWDGLMYSSASALGFATAENVKYVLGYGDPTILLGRSLLATFGHVLMSACWGYSLGLQKSRLSRSRFLTLQGLLWASLGHGAYDFFLMQGHSLPAVGVLAMLFWVFRLRLRDAVLESRYRVKQVRAVSECPGCRGLVRAGEGYCTSCGKPLGEGLPLHCGQCLERVAGAGPCLHCHANVSAPGPPERPPGSLPSTSPPATELP